jgi:DNA-binding NtrC family response regulator
MSAVTQVNFLGMAAVVASPAMRQTLELVERVAPTMASVLITGETGSGKEIVARAVHHYSTRARRPWVDVNCGALPDTLMESELFGHERGAFSGADCARPGLFELADTGTLFLDEVGELDARMQVKLLRALDGVGYYRLGGRRRIDVDTRIVAATNRSLEEAVETGRFRGDLYHRLNQYPVRVPPLRERREDIVPLAEYFARQQREDAAFSDAARRMLLDRSWPGNVRELRNAVTGALLRACGPVIDVSDFAPAPPPSGATAPATLRLEGLEREAIVQALRQSGGHCQRAADMLGISRRTLSRRLRSYGPEVRAEAAQTNETPVTR